MYVRVLAVRRHDADHEAYEEEGMSEAHAPACAPHIDGEHVALASGGGCCGPPVVQGIAGQAAAVVADRLRPALAAWQRSRRAAASLAALLVAGGRRGRLAVLRPAPLGTVRGTLRTAWGAPRSLRTVWRCHACGH